MLLLCIFTRMVKKLRTAFKPVGQCCKEVMLSTKALLEAWDVL